ncbi:VTT domain-containing protein [Desulfovibrio aminophilus]|uniref:DedA family protein n=1 Tax=Desulfovibrio aminophilus TaxID=81425 RepID=UPI003390FA7D
MEMLQHVIAQYGYFALFLGTFLEGETIMLLCGFAAFTGHMDLTLVMLAGGAGTFFGDQLYFYIGRWKGMAVFERWPKLKGKAYRVACLLHRYRYAVILSFRFFYGLRNVTPFVIGMSPIKAWQYFGLNLIAAVVWSVTFASLGYLFGSAAESVLHDVKQVEMYVFGVIILLALAIWIIRKLRSKAKHEVEECAPHTQAAEDEPVPPKDHQA